MALMHDLQSANKCVALEFTFNQKGGCNVIGSRIRFQLIQKPEPSLGMRQFITISFRNSRYSLIALVPPGIDKPGKFADSRAGKEIPHRDLYTEQLIDPRNDADRLQRVSADFNEWIARADTAKPQHLAPYFCQPLFSSSNRFIVAGNYHFLRFWQSLAVNLAVQTERQTLHPNEIGWHHVIRQTRKDKFTKLRLGDRLLFGVVAGKDVLHFVGTMRYDHNLAYSGTR